MRMDGPGGPETVDLLVRHGHLLVMDDADTRIADGAVAIRGRTIVAAGPDAEIAARFRAAREIDARGAPVHPGLVETHLHASFHTYRCVVPDHMAEEAVFDAIEARFYNTVTDEEEELAVLLASLEMIRNGTTCFLEAGTVLAPEAAARAAQTVGIRAILGDTFIWDRPVGLQMGQATGDGARGVPSRLVRTPASREEALAALGGELRRNADPDALVTGHVAVLGLGTASEELLLAAKAAADAAGVVLNFHHAYSPADTAADRERYGKDPLLHLAEIGVLGRNVTLGHANHLTDAECEVLLATGTSLAWAPAASMVWGHGGSRHGRHAELWRRGLNVGLGSDSANWSNEFDLFRQANLAILATREGKEDRMALMPEEVLGMAIRGGARAAGMEDRIGTLTAGKRADLVIHTPDRPEAIPTGDPVRMLIGSARSRTVHTVIVDGRVILDGGRFPHLDEPALLRRIDAASHALLARMGVTVERNRVPPRRAV